MSRVLVTGASGFVGANLVRALLERGDEVSVLIRPGSEAWRLRGVFEKLDVQYGDMSDVESLTRIVRVLMPEVIFNLAGAGAASRAVVTEQEIVSANLIGFMNLAQSLEMIPYKALIHVGSSLEYGVKDSPLKEDDSCNPMNVYAITKLAATNYATYLGKVKNKPVLTFRCFSLFGPYDDHNRVIPKTLDAFIQGKPLFLANPRAVRDFVFVQDAIELFLEGAHRAEELKGEIFNVGSGEESSLEELVALVKNEIKTEVDISWGDVSLRPGEPKVARADMTKTLRVFPWRPKHTLEQGLQKVHAWLTENQSQSEVEVLA